MALLTDSVFTPARKLFKSLSSFDAKITEETFVVSMFQEMDVLCSSKTDGSGQPMVSG